MSPNSSTTTVFHTKRAAERFHAELAGRANVVRLEIRKRRSTTMLNDHITYWEVVHSIMLPQESQSDEREVVYSSVSPQEAQ